MDHPLLDHRALRWISDQYYDMNGSYIDVLDSPPSPVQFARLCHISRPVVIKGVDITARSRWSDEYLAQIMEDRLISVAVTPNGRADAVTSGSDGTLYFAEPCIEQMTMAELLKHLSTENPPAIHYLQSQNGNMYTSGYFESRDPGSEFESLRQDVPSEISWCSDVFDRKPDAVNLWIGNHHSHTSIHSDPYENIYTVVRGAKHFVLLPPTEGWCLKEEMYPHAVYTHISPTTFELIPSPPSTPPVRWSSIQNPHLPNAFCEGAHPIHVTLHAGETLYLPVGWWHHVRQSEGITIALNWWYDAEMRGGSWTWLSLLRGPSEEVDDENNEDHNR